MKVCNAHVLFPRAVSASVQLGRLYVDDAAVSRFNKLQALVRSIRNARAEYKVSGPL
jgi:hypothetical protein